LVPERGLEPPLPCENQVLNLARLPIPPFGHKYNALPRSDRGDTAQRGFFILPAALRFVNASGSALGLARFPFRRASSSKD
jgi:hypothetical protein